MHNINITPLTDVLLVLLITFLLSASSFQEASSGIRLPQLLEPKEVADRMTRVEIDILGQVVWPQSSLAPRSTRDGFQALRVTAEHEVLALAVHRDLPYDKLYGILIDARQAGWEQIVLLTEASP